MKISKVLILAVMGVMPITACSSSNTTNSTTTPTASKTATSATVNKSFLTSQTDIKSFLSKLLAKQSDIHSSHVDMATQIGNNDVHSGVIHESSDIENIGSNNQESNSTISQSYDDDYTSTNVESYKIVIGNKSWGKVNNGSWYVESVLMPFTPTNLVTTYDNFPNFVKSVKISSNSKYVLVLSPSAASSTNVDNCVLTILTDKNQHIVQTSMVTTYKSGNKFTTTLKQSNINSVSKTITKPKTIES